MYAAQGMRNKWYGMLGADFVEESDEDQDSLKVEILCLFVFSFAVKNDVTDNLGQTFHEYIYCRNKIIRNDVSSFYTLF